MLVNKDITHWLGDEADNYGLLGRYNNCNDYQGSKQGMRLRWSRDKKPQVDWWEDHHHGRWGLLSQIEGFVEKRIGQPFSEVYSEFLNKFDADQMLSSSTLKDWFKTMFVSTKYNKSQLVRNWRRRAAQYYIDEQGLIQQTPRTTIKKVRPLYYWTGEYTYDINTQWLDFNRSTMFDVGGQDIYDKLMSDPDPKWLKMRLLPEIRKISSEWYEKYPNTFNRRLRSWRFDLDIPMYFGGDLAEYLYKCMVSTKPVYTKYDVQPGTPEYDAVVKEIKKKHKQIKSKEKGTGMGEYYDSILKAKKHRKNE